MWLLAPSEARLSTSKYILGPCSGRGIGHTGRCRYAPGVRSTAPGSPRTRSTARTLAAALCLLQALALVGFAGFYLVELVAGGASDVGAVVMSVALFLVVAAGLAYLARRWWTGSGAVTTPTVVWNVLLVPVAVGLAQSGQLILAVVLAVAVLVAIVAALAAGRAGAGPGETDPESS